MYTAVILEDELPALKLLEMIIGSNESFTITGSFANPAEALGALPALQPDVIFMDIEMPHMNGVKLAQRIREISGHTQIVFTTGHMKYAVDAFDVQAMDYIVKPVTPKAIKRVYERLTKLQALEKAADKVSISPSITGFGGLEVRNTSHQLMHFPTRHTEELFAYFLCYPNREVNKWKLSELLWPDMDGERALHNLYTAIYRVKGVISAGGLPMRIMKTSEGYNLITGTAVYDVMLYQQAERLLTGDALEPEQLEQLFALYKGPLFHGKPYVWKISLEEKYRLIYEKLSLRLIGEAIVRGELQAAEDRFYTCLLADPSNEDFYRHLLRLFSSKDQKRRMQQFYQRRMEELSRLNLG